MILHVRLTFLQRKAALDAGLPLVYVIRVSGQVEKAMKKCDAVMKRLRSMASAKNVEGMARFETTPLRRDCGGAASMRREYSPPSWTNPIG